ncbi:MAGE family-domain-containing protein [Aspergillus karnatakaensis]|uniref:MAGE family-domain-containing protein n=1 Tax=Aspergillus karnatakaensis TaxID=1810916 RepID=UPI003CCCE326
MGENTVNGDRAQSQFLEHLTSYPVVSDSITVYKTNKYGAKSLEFADKGYGIAKPYLPYLSKPYGYVAPYVARADSLGDQGLHRVDSTFPFIKEDTSTLKSTIYDTAYYPLRLAGDVKNHLFSTYGDEYKKCGGDGIVASGKAIITTSLVLSQESLAFISSLLQQKKAQVKDLAPADSDDEASASPATTQPQPQRRARREATPEESENESGDGATLRTPSSTDVMVKKLVRLALSSEYSRQPIRRADISNKVLGETGSRQFKKVFDEAQKVLEEVFGMQLVELPGKERVTIQQRRAAQKLDRPSSTNKSWILTSTLPSKYRKQDIIRPTRGPMEGAYTGLYTFIIALILLNGGTIQEQKLDRYLTRVNAETFTPIDRTDRFLQRLCREGYLIRNREMDGGDEIIEYMVGPRGKIEVGARGVAGLVREVYGRQAMVEGDDITAAEREKMEEFEFRLSRSLGFTTKKNNNHEDATNARQEDDDEEAGEGPSRRRRRRGEETESSSSSEESDE